MTALIVCIMSMALSGCQFAVTIDPAGSATMPRFLFAEQGWFAARNAVFTNFSVSRRMGNEWTVQWQIDASNGGCEHGTAEVTYGRAPSGFVADKPPFPLREGEIYEAGLSGCGRIGLINFKIEHGQIVLLDPAAN